MKIATTSNPKILCGFNSFPFSLSDQYVSKMSYLQALSVGAGGRSIRDVNHLRIERSDSLANLVELSDV
jgi:hypothetical protein